MEKADILEMTVSYLRAAQRKDLRVQGVYKTELLFLTI